MWQQGVNFVQQLIPGFHVLESWFQGYQQLHPDSEMAANVGASTSQLFTRQLDSIPTQKQRGLAEQTHPLSR